MRNWHNEVMPDSDKSRCIRFGMVGGGAGSFIGPVHRMAAELDGNIRLVAGAFSSDAGRSREAGLHYGLSPERSYSSYAALFAGERQRDDGIDFVAIVTPNHLHLPVAKAALEQGFHVLSDKPATATLAEGLTLRELVQRSGRLYGLTYTYTGYGLVREARRICARGDLGAIRKVVVEYSQGWLAERIESTGQRQAAWRCDPAQAGIGGCIGDIGVHAFNLLEFVTGLRVAEVAAQLSSVVPGRLLDDDCNVLLRLGNGAPAVLVASQIAAGERNGLTLKVYGERGGLAWSHDAPNRLTLSALDGDTRILHGGANAPALGEVARAAFRLPLGHPEGYIEAFANIYRDFAALVRAGDTGSLQSSLVPTIDAGLRGMAFVDAAVRSSRAGSAWTAVNESPGIG
jgi:predicted dehydrogenase